jgi:hypothetical protein
MSVPFVPGTLPLAWQGHFLSHFVDITEMIVSAMNQNAANGGASQINL